MINQSIIIKSIHLGSLIATTTMVKHQTSAASRPKPGAQKLPLVAITTRTLGVVVASLWSSYWSSPPLSSSTIRHQRYHDHPIYFQNGKKKIYFPQAELSRYGFSPFLSFRYPLPFVSAFQPETTTGIPRRQPRQWQRHLQQHQHRRKIDNGLHRWSHSNISDRGRSFNNLAGTSKGDDGNDDDSSSTALSPTSVSDDTAIAVESTRHLPRLFVEGTAKYENNAAGVAPLQPSFLVPLTADQEHYLLDVMRITNPKRWGGRKKKSRGDNGDDDEDGMDYTGCVRIFNGVDGEWLARVVVEGSSGSGKPNHRRKKKQNRPHEAAAAAATTVLECLQPLRSQASGHDGPDSGDEGSRPPRLRLCLGYIRDKQRRRWVFEKATELGVDDIAVLETDFVSGSGRDSYKTKDLRWEEDREKHRYHVIEASEQSERLTVPSIGAEPLSVDAVKEEVLTCSSSAGDGDGKDDLWLVCRERSESSPPILAVLDETFPSSTSGPSSPVPAPTTVHVLVGPEGGWSPRELEVFSGLTGSGLRFVSLGSSVLRAETAAVAAVAAVQMHRDADVGRM